MLDYAPDGLAGPVLWSEEMLDDGALLQLIAASKSAALRSRAEQPACRAFQPERLSGFCAT